MKWSVLHRVMLAVTALCMVLSLMGCGAALQAVQQLRGEPPETPPGVQTGETGSKPAETQAPGQPAPEAEPAQPEQPAPQGIGGGDAHRAFMPHGGCPFPRKKVQRRSFTQDMCPVCMNDFAHLGWGL